MATVFEELEGGVVVGSGACGVRLRLAGRPSDIGFPTMVDARAGPFSGALFDPYVGSYGRFVEDLTLLYERLSGTAVLGSDHGSILELNGLRGHIDVKVSLLAGHFPLVHLQFEFVIDQSYLPEIIRSLRRELSRDWG